MESAKKKLVCPLCKSQEFTQEQGKIDSKWGLTAHKITLQICNKCGFIMQFSRGRSIWDFD